ncbi:MAG: hypothetical protein JNM79_18325 [Burkholderiales bacterium]|jgi:hypothetical protein|nr:hypothetical protein [Burkholderiales bacterium]
MTEYVGSHLGEILRIVLVVAGAVLLGHLFGFGDASPDASSWDGSDCGHGGGSGDSCD